METLIIDVVAGVTPEILITPVNVIDVEDVVKDMKTTLVVGALAQTVTIDLDVAIQGVTIDLDAGALDATDHAAVIGNAGITATAADVNSSCRW